LVLLLKALQLNVDDEEEQNNIRKILVKDDDNLLLLQTNNINQHLFNKYVREGTPPNRKELKNHANGNLYGAVREIESFLDRWKEGGRSFMDLLRLIRNRIGFVVYDTEESHAVYTIFECLNSRGLDVDWLDKVKSLLMRIAFERSKSVEAAEAKINELHHFWARIYDEMARYPLSGQEILRITATLFVGAGAGKALSADDSIERVRKHCDTAEQTLEVTGWLLAVTEKLVQLQKSRHWAPLTRILQVRVLAVALMLAGQLTEEEKQSALEQWERVSFRIYGLFGKDSRSKVGDYIRLAFRIIQKDSGASDYSTIMEELRSLGSDYPVKDAVQELLERPRYEGYEEEIRYILWRYEEYLAAKMKAQVNKELRAEIWATRSPAETIEHIFPQNPEKGGPWAKKLNKYERLENHVDRLGNLLLLPPGLNSEAGRRSFSEKKKIYTRAEGLRTVREVIVKEDWTQDSIEERERRIGNFLRKAFADI